MKDLVDHINTVAEFAGFNQPGAAKEDKFDLLRHAHADVRLESHVRKLGRARGVSVIIREHSDAEKVLKKLNLLRARAVKTLADNEKQWAEAQNYKRRMRRQTKELEREWKGHVRAAFGGDPNVKLPPELRPKVMSDSTLLDRRMCADITLRMPADLAKRAAILKDIDEIMHKHSITEAP
jgi:hypothetical protein